jgi:hypothetical protein
LAKFFGGSLVCAVRRRRTSDDHKVDTAWRDHATVTLAQPPLDPIANHRISNLLAHGKPDSGSLLAFGLGTEQRIDHQIPSGNPAPAVLYRQETGSRSQAIPTAESFVAACVAHQAYFLGTLTVSFLRPLRRRRRSTSRPAGVLMRFRKPWVRLRLFRCGWKVLFDT